jgi:hypothetical protein
MPFNGRTSSRPDWTRCNPTARALSTPENLNTLSRTTPLFLNQLVLNLPDNAKPFPDLDTLLRYLGYKTLNGKDLDVLAGEELAKQVHQDRKEGDVLIGRYFSPKTSDVSGRSN